MASAGIVLLQQARSDGCTNPNFPVNTTYPNGELICETTPVTYNGSGIHSMHDVYVHDNNTTSNALATGGTAPIAGMSSDIVGHVGIVGDGSVYFTSLNNYYDHNTYCIPSNTPPNDLWFTWSYNTEINVTNWLLTGGTNPNDPHSTFNVKGSSC
jgi:hypothetical protein